ncbi:hypothetical protein [Amycolatopsis tolypomycina]|uniref:hypothetical protein n=1 Tax=Amycolatopsis tolypomycina TaxID=208445 RepID=UPI000A75CA4A
MLDAVLCNAGVALDAPPRLMPVLAPTARIVTTGSFAAKSAHLDFADLQSSRKYAPKRAYERSKLAQTLFALELDRRLRVAGPRVFGLRGRPRLEARWANLTDDAAAARLWPDSVALAGLDPLG